jgi:RNA polymerase sigma-70 factor, ECF subfamily
MQGRHETQLAAGPNVHGSEGLLLLQGTDDAGCVPGAGNPSQDVRPAETHPNYSPATASRDDAMERRGSEAQGSAQAGNFGATQERRRHRVGISQSALAAPGLQGRAASDARAHGARESSAVETVEMTEDIRLVRRTLEGDKEAFSVLVEKYKDPVYNVAYRMLGNSTEAEDVAQETFVRAYTQLRTYKDTHRFSTWLLSIASHLAIDQLRRRRFLALPLENVPFLEWIADLGAGPEQATMQAETSDEMQRLLQQLPPKYRAVLVLRYWHDLSYEEIAGVLHLTPALVKARLHRARELVARRMHAEADELGLDEQGDEQRTEHAAGSGGNAARKEGTPRAAAAP